MRYTLSLSFAAAAITAALSFSAPTSAEAKSKCGGPCQETIVKCVGSNGNRVEVLTVDGNAAKYQANCLDGGTRSVIQTHKQQKFEAAPVYQAKKPSKKKNKARSEQAAVRSTAHGSINTSIKCGNTINGGDIIVEFGRCPASVGGSATFAPIDQDTLRMALANGLAVVQYSNEVKGCYYFKDAKTVRPNHYKVNSNKGVLISNGGFSTSGTAKAIGYGPNCGKTKYGTVNMIRVGSVQAALGYLR